jgi:hypothetical protein
VRVVLDAKAPTREPRSGKLRQVLRKMGSEPHK